MLLTYSNILCIIVLYGGIDMGKFKLPVIPTSSTRSIRFPDHLIKRVENAIKGNQVTFNAFIVAATEFALDELQETKEDNNLILNKK